MSKLTLSVDESTIRMAKEYARRNNTSISALFTRLIHGLAERSDPESVSQRETSTLGRLTGVLSVPDGLTYEDLRRKAVKEKYGI